MDTAQAQNGAPHASVELEPNREPEIETEKTPPLRSKNIPKTDPLEKLGDKLDSQNEQLAIQTEILKRLAASIVGGHAVAAVASTRPDPTRETPDAFVPTHGRLVKVILGNGDHSYSMPLDYVSDHAKKLMGFPREAFVHRAPDRPYEHVEMIDTGDRELRAAMEFAKRKWGDDGVILHVADKHRDAVIRHAVAAGLNIANKDVELQRLVAAERERQANPILRDRGDYQRSQFPVIERASGEDFKGRPSADAQRSPTRYELLEQSTARAR